MVTLNAINRLKGARLVIQSGMNYTGVIGCLVESKLAFLLQYCNF